MSGAKGIRAEPQRPGLPSHPDSPTCGSPSHHHSPALARLCPPGPPPSYPLPRRQRGRGGGEGQWGPEGAGATGMPQWLPAAPSQSPPGRGEAARAEGGRGGRDWQDGGPSESSHSPAATGTSYWMYCFLHSGVMCAERCSANFILTFPPHFHSCPAVTGGGRDGGGGNSDSDSSPHGPRRGAALRFSPPPPPPRSPQSRPPAIFLLLSIAPPRPAHYTSSPW